jgi:hypothetical protein
VEGYDIVQRTNQIAYSDDGKSWHTRNSTGAPLGCITCRAHLRAKPRRALRVSVERLVYARHGHELMG